MNFLEALQVTNKEKKLFKGIKIVKVCIGEWKNQSRDEREMTLLQELGAEVVIVAKTSDIEKSEIINGLKIEKISTKPIKFKPLTFFNKGVGFIKWILYVRKKNADILSCHDLIALFIGYVSNIGKKYRAKLVYDSHEFELGRNTKRNKFVVCVIKILEGFLIRRVDLAIMVNESIANEVQTIYKLENRPVVVRNIPEYWNLDFGEIELKRKELVHCLNGNEKTFFLMFHGAIMPNRGIENLIDVISQMDDIGLVILGNGEKYYIDYLKNLSRQKKCTSKIYFHEAVPLSDLYMFVGAADVGMINILGKNKSYYYMLPNKFFENIQSLTPVIVSNFPEVSKIVDEYNIGIKVDPNSIAEIIEAIEKMRYDKILYATFKSNLKKAKEELCWEKEKKVLEQAYEKLVI